MYERIYGTVEASVSAQGGKEPYTDLQWILKGEDTEE